MPLTLLHREHIKSCTESLFSYWIEKEEKNPDTLINKISQAISGELAPTDDFFELQQRLLSPALTVKGIDNKAYGDPKITIGEIQLCLLEILTTELKTRGFIQENAKWNQDQFIAKLTSGETFDTPYVPPQNLHQPLHTHHPDEILTPGRTFTANIITSSHNRPNVNLNIHYNNRSIPKYDFTTVLGTFPGPVGDDPENIQIETFIQNLKRNALEEQISNIVGRNILSIFTKEALELLTYDFYFKGLYNGDIPFILIHQIDKTQLNTLTSPTIINDIKRGKCTLFNALGYTDGGRIVLTHHYYRNEIRENRATREEFASLSADEGLNITMPNALNLIILGKLARNNVQSMTPHCRALLAINFWYNRIKISPDDFALISKINRDQLDCLGNQIIINLIYQNKLSIQNALKIPKHNIAYLNHPLIAKLVNEGIILVNDQINELDLIMPNLKSPQDYSTLLLDVLQNKLDKLEKEYLRKLIADYLVLSSNQLMAETDIVPLLDYAVNISFKTNDYTQREEKLPNSFAQRLNFDWNNHPPATKLCSQHLQERLYSLLGNTPRLIKSLSENDTITNIQSCCKQLNLSFSDLVFKVLNDIAKNHLTSNGDNRFANLAKYSKELNINELDIWKCYFLQRLNHFPCTLEDKPDTTEKIELHLHTVAKDKNISAHELYQAIMNAVIDNLKTFVGTEINSPKKVSYSVVLKIKKQIDSHQKKKTVSEPKALLSQLHPVATTELAKLTNDVASQTSPSPEIKAIYQLILNAHKIKLPTPLQSLTTRHHLFSRLTKAFKHNENNSFHQLEDKSIRLG